MAKRDGIKKLDDGTTEFVMSVATDQVPLIGEAFAQQYNYILPDLEEGQTRSPEEEMALKMTFARSQVIQYVREVVRGYHAWVAQEAARQNIPDSPIEIS